MKKLSALFLAVAGFVPIVAAQDVITGTVVDIDGNPLPGVKIEIPGTPETVISDLDGTFTITRSDLSKKKLLASYAGMSSQKVKMKDGMVIKMTEANWRTSDFSTSVEFNPFNGKNNETFSIDALSFRYFFADKHALTLDLGLSYKNAKNVPDTENDKNFDEYNYGKFSIDLGYEYHFKTVGRMDLFAGAKIGYTRHFAGGKTVYFAQNGPGDRWLWSRTEETKYTNITPDGKHYAGNAIRFGILTGFDFYVYKGLFVGATIALELEDNLIVNNKTKSTISYTGHPTSSDAGTIETETKKGGHDFDLNTLVHPQIRLGWSF